MARPGCRDQELAGEQVGDAVFYAFVTLAASLQLRLL